MHDQTRRHFYQTFAKIGLLSFGGPAAQIALMHRVLVAEQAWLKEREFSTALSFCMLLPGPEAMQLATYAGWKLRGIAGGLAAGLLFILPGACLIWALAFGYIIYGATPWVEDAFLGIKASVITIVALALIRLAQRTLLSAPSRLIALCAFLGLFVLAMPYPLVLIMAAIGGLALLSNSKHAVSLQPVGKKQPLRVLAVGLPLWLAPLVFLHTLGFSFLTELSLYFAKLAVLSFGGAYALLGWMVQTVVQDHGWVTATQMMDALGLAETTPGPLILVTQFVGHLAGYGQGGIGLAALAGVLTLWTVFLPCFIFIFVGAPYIEQILAQPRLQAALDGITAGVNGVIASLSLWFAVSVLWPGQRLETLSSPDWAAALLIVTGATLAWRSRANLFVVILGNAVLSVLFHQILFS